MRVRNMLSKFSDKMGFSGFSIQDERQISANVSVYTLERRGEVFLGLKCLYPGMVQYVYFNSVEMENIVQYAKQVVEK